jgi:hypothetical protein
MVGETRSGLCRLEAMLARVPGERVSIGAVVDNLGAGTWGLCFLLFGLAALVPGIAPAFGVALCVIAAGMMLGQRHPWLPERLRRWHAGRGQLRAGMRRLQPILGWVEARLSPRGAIFLSPAILRLTGMAVLLNAILVVLPIPFGNTAPAIAILALALGLTTNDGLMVLVGMALTAIALAIDAVLVWAGWQAVSALFTWLF